MDSNTPSEAVEKAPEEDSAPKDSEPSNPEGTSAPSPDDAPSAETGDTDVNVVDDTEHGDSGEQSASKPLDDSQQTAQSSSPEEDSAPEQSEQTEASTISKPKRLSRLAENDRPPEDPKFRFLSDPERDGKGLPAADDAKEQKDDGKQKDAERKNRKKVSRIPSARRGNKAPGQCENCGGCPNARRPHEDPAGEQGPERSFQRNTRERNSYPGPRRHETRPDDQQKWGHAMYYELYGEEQGRPQRPRRRGRGDYHGGGGGPPRDFNNNNRDEQRPEGNEGNFRYNGNRKPEQGMRSDRFGGPRRPTQNTDATGAEKQDEGAQKNRQNFNNGGANGGERGGRRGQGSFRGRGSFRRRNSQKQPSSEKGDGESAPAAPTA